MKNTAHCATKIEKKGHTKVKKIALERSKKWDTFVLVINAELSQCSNKNKMCKKR